MANGQGNLNTLIPQPGQTSFVHKSYHPLPGPWAQEQMQKSDSSTHQKDSSSAPTGSSDSSLQKALRAEASQHTYWEQWQGVTPGTPVYEDPRAWQNTLLPTAKYGTDGR